ncbi:hypothetical protein F5Y13DRAFT_195099 [Hypoxylon sp. FL1857]|nr:hypothetical protein F5Y13DRAFT_195099 [Hypoxylon sp. FL1857]
MDPLSITASVVTLIDAAKKVYSLVQSLRHADSKFAALCEDLRTFMDYLQLIKEALEDGLKSRLGLAPIQERLWERSKITLDDIQKILDKLSELVRRMGSRTIFGRSRVAIDMQLYAKDVICFRDKIKLSLSLRNNTSQELVLKELKKLRKFLQRSNEAALDLDELDICLAQHFKGLVQEARDFHVTASTTASTVYGEERQGLATNKNDADASSSIPSRIPSFKRRQIERFLRTNQMNYPEVVTEESRDVFDSLYSGGLSKIAQTAIRQFDFGKAEIVLSEILKRYKGKTQQAEDLILDLAEFRPASDTIERQLLYALTMAYLHEMKFCEARKMGERLWETRQAPNTDNHPTKKDILTLLAATCRFSEATLEAEAIVVQYPDIRFLSPMQPMSNVVDFVAGCDELLFELFGPVDPTLQSAEKLPMALRSRLRRLPLATRSSPFQLHMGEGLGSSEGDINEILKHSGARKLIKKHSSINRNLHWPASRIKSSRSSISSRSGSRKQFRFRWNVFARITRRLSEMKALDGVDDESEYGRIKTWIRRLPDHEYPDSIDTSVDEPLENRAAGWIEAGEIIPPVELEDTSVAHSSILVARNSPPHHPNPTQPTIFLNGHSVPHAFESHQAGHDSIQGNGNAVIGDFKRLYSLGLEITSLSRNEPTDLSDVPHVACGTASQQQVGSKDSKCVKTSPVDSGYQSGNTITPTASMRNIKSLDAGGLRRRYSPQRQTVPVIRKARRPGAAMAPVDPHPVPDSSTDSSPRPREIDLISTYLGPEGIPTPIAQNLNAENQPGRFPEGQDGIMMPIELDSQPITRKQFKKRSGNFTGDRRIKPTPCVPPMINFSLPRPRKPPSPPFLG